MQLNLNQATTKTEIQINFKQISQFSGQIVQAINAIKNSSGGNNTLLTQLQAEVASLQEQLTEIQNEIGGLHEYVASVAVGAFALVYESSQGAVSLCDNTKDPTAQPIVGLTTKNANGGSKVPVAGNGTTVFNPSWAWTIYQPIFASTTGSLTQTPPVAGWQCIVGYATSATSMFIAISQPIYFDAHGNPAQFLTVLPSGEFAPLDFVNGTNTTVEQNSSGRFFINAEMNVVCESPSYGLSLIDEGLTTLWQVSLRPFKFIAPVQGSVDSRGVIEVSLSAAAVTGVDGAAAPPTTAAGAVTNRYGGPTNFLGDPDGWAELEINGTMWKVPLYSP